MKTSFFRFLVALACVPVSLSGQSAITIDNNDMPSPGDTFRVSLGLITPAVDPVPTGPNFLWDFSNLQQLGQTVDTFLSISQTSGTYQVVFVNIGLNPNRANLASKGNFAVPPVPGLAITDVFNFYYNSSSSFKLVGFGAKINGLSTPVPWDNKDIIYKFPLDFNDTDSSDSNFSLSIPTLGFYSYEQHRVNVCEGWGTLITPYGSFAALKVKSTLLARDSVFISATNFGFGNDRPVTREYKWLGAGMGIPLLEITTMTGFGGQENVIGIRYRDSLRTPLGVPGAQVELGMSVFPVPAHDRLHIDFTLDHHAEVKLSLLDATGRLAGEPYQNTFQPGHVLIHYALDASLTAGMYFLSIEVDGRRNVIRVPVR